MSRKNVAENHDVITDEAEYERNQEAAGQTVLEEIIGQDMPDEQEMSKDTSAEPEKSETESNSDMEYVVLVCGASYRLRNTRFINGKREPVDKETAEKLLSTNLFKRG